MSVPQITQGVRIVEVSDYVFVPVAGAVLAGWGADVIKVEHHERGDALRDMAMHRAANSGNAPRSGVGVVPANRGKRSIGINLASDEGREVLYELVKNADVFITNRTNPMIEKLGITLEEIRAHNPNIIYARGTAHGSRGPEADRGGFDVADFWYRSGIAAGTRVPGAELPPYMPSPGFGDNTSGHNLAAGILGALFHRERTGEALTVEVSLLSSALWAMTSAINISSRSGEPVPQNPRGRNPNPLHNIYQTSEGMFINMCTLQGIRYLAEFCRLIDLDHIAHDERYNTNEGFYKNADELTAIFAERIASFTREEFMARLETYTGQWAPVQDSYTIASDVQVEAMGYLAKMWPEPEDPMKDVVPPVQYNSTPTELRPAPEFNQHGEDILKELGFSAEKIDELKAAGAVTK